MQNTCFIISCHWKLVCQQFPAVAYLLALLNQAPTHHLLLLITSSATCRREGSRPPGPAVSTPPQRRRHAFPDRFHMSVAQSYVMWWHGSLGGDSLISLTAVSRSWWRDAAALSCRQNEEQRWCLQAEGQQCGGSWRSGCAADSHLELKRPVRPLKCPDAR